MSRAPVASAETQQDWRTRFRLLWTSESTGVFGAEIAAIALPLIAVQTLGATAFQMGVLTAASTAPNLLFALSFGVLADRVRSRRTLMLASDVSRAVLFAVVPLAWWGGFLSTGLLIAIGFGVGTASLCFRVAWNSYLPAIVPADNLVQANSKLRGTSTLAGLVGSGLGGALVSLLGGPQTLVITAAALCGSVAFLLAVRDTALARDSGDVRGAPGTGESTVAGDTAGQREHHSERRSARRDIADGLRFVWDDGRLRAITLAAANLNVCASMLLALLVLYLTRQLGFSPALVGVVFIASGAGAIGGAVAAHPLGRAVGAGRAVVAGSLVFSVALFLYPAVAAAPMWLALSVLVGVGAVFGAAVMIFDVHSAALRQRITPEPLQGRVAATMTFVTQGARPVGALLGGAFGELIGVTGTLWLGAAFAVGAFGWTLASPLRGPDDPTGLDGTASQDTGPDTDDAASQDTDGPDADAPDADGPDADAAPRATAGDHAGA